MNDNQNIKSDVLAALMNEEKHASTITRFVADHFSELVPDPDYFAHLVRDDVGGEMLPPLPEEVIGRLPRYYTAVTALYDTPFLKTSQVTALFALTGAMMPNAYVRHGRRLMSPAVMVIHYGTSGAGKGNISDLRTLFEGVDRHRIEESERALQQYDYDMEAYKQNLKCHFADRKEVQPTGRRAPEGLQKPKKPLRRSLEIPADTSSADFVLRLKGNEPYPSLLMSEELLTTVSSNRAKHGDFVHYILNCYHEEPIHRGRKTDDEDTIVHRPRLAMLLSGTMGAVRQFIPSVEDGLASRMLFVELPFALPWIDELTDAEAHRFNSTLRETADVATQMYEALRRFDSSHTKVTLSLTEQQSRYVNRMMARMNDHFFFLYGHQDIVPAVRRRHLDAKRLMLQVALMRRYEQCGSWMEALAQPAVTIDDDDIDTVLFIAYWSVQQTMHLYRRLVRYDDAEPAASPATKPEEILARLPAEFTRKDAVRVGEEFGVTARTVERYLTIWQKTSAVELVSRGHYRRLTV